MSLADWEEIVAARHSEFELGNMKEWEYRLDLRKLGFSNEEINIEVARHTPTGKKYPETGFVSGLPDWKHR
jgi:hypothetical protein